MFKNFQDISEFNITSNKKSYRIPSEIQLGERDFTAYREGFVVKFYLTLINKFIARNFI